MIPSPSKAQSLLKRTWEPGGVDMSMSARVVGIAVRSMEGVRGLCKFVSDIDKDYMIGFVIMSNG